MHHPKVLRRLAPSSALNWSLLVRWPSFLFLQLCSEDWFRFSPQPCFTVNWQSIKFVKAPEDAADASIEEFSQAFSHIDQLLEYLQYSSISWPCVWRISGPISYFSFVVFQFAKHGIYQSILTIYIQTPSPQALTLITYPMALQSHLNTERYHHKSPNEHHRLPTLSIQPLDNRFAQSTNRQNQHILSPRAKNSMGDGEEDHPSTVKLMMMKEMVMGLLVHHYSDNKEVDEALNQLLSHLKIMLGCVPKKNLKVSGNQRSDTDLWAQQSARLNLILNKLRAISQTKQIREAILALQKLRDKIVLQTGSNERSEEVRRSQIFREKSPLGIPKQSQRLQNQLRQLKAQMMLLRKEKVKLMMELNRQIDISNEKSEEIEMLQNILCKKQTKPNRVAPAKADRFRSSSKDTSLHIQLSLKEQQISMLINENASLKSQIKQLKEITFSQSFLSDAFNKRDQDKEKYEKAISTLQARVYQLQNQGDPVKLSECDDKRNSFQQTAECKSSFKNDKDRSNELPKALQCKVSDLETMLKRQVSLRISLEKQADFLRAQEKSLNLQIVFLKNEVDRLKSPSIFNPSQQLGRGTSSGAGYRSRR